MPKYFTSPYTMYLQDATPDSSLDKIFINAYKKGYSSVVRGNKKWKVADEIERIQKKKQIRLNKPIPNKAQLKSNFKSNFGSLLNKKKSNSRKKSRSRNRTRSSSRKKFSSKKK